MLNKLLDLRREIFQLISDVYEGADNKSLIITEYSKGYIAGMIFVMKRVKEIMREQDEGNN